MPGSGDIQVRPLSRQELGLVEAHINLDWAASGKHRARLDRHERGEVLYFIAWRGATPSGHLLLEWGGAKDEPIRSKLLDCPNLEDLFVMPEFRSRGIGSMLLDAAITAARLYEQNGFQDSGLGEYTSGGIYLDLEGTVQTWQETCTYWIKLLSCARPA